ncbi:MAG: GMC family oxidoreductase N-terminal domain-containing protein, partial [Polyangiaceae bacterium]
CFPAFLRLENDLDIKNQWHSQSGPVPVRRHPANELVPWQAAFMAACERQGYSHCPDHNAPDARGYGPHAMNKIDGRRMSAARCYLTPEVRKRPGLTIQPNSLVIRVLFDSSTAVGVEVEQGGTRETIRSNRVILCGGAIATPGVLLRSGVGPREQLEALGVPLVSNNPAVGSQLLDHPGSAMFLLPKRGVCSLDHPLIQTAMRLRSKKGSHANDMQIQAGSVVHLPKFSVPLVSLMVQVGKPHGKGSIRWTSADPHARPMIHSGLLDDPRDRAVALEALDVALGCADTREMRALATPIWPPPAVLRRASLLDAVVRNVSDSGYHPCGTVPMGEASDRSAATDEYGRVKGTTGLFVADASLMPTVPTANTHLPTLMIGERFGEWFRDRVIE